MQSDHFTGQNTLTLQQRLHALHDIRNRLLHVPTVDELCRLAVELGCAHLGFDRLSIWFAIGLEQARGSFGTDETGQVRDERQARVGVAPTTPMGRILRRETDLVLERDVLLDHTAAAVGQGMHAIAALWDGLNVLGCVSADNFINHLPLTADNGEVLRLYASIIGHLLFQKQTEVILRTRERVVAYAEGHSLDDVMQFTLDCAEQLTGSQIGFFHFLDDDQQTLTLQMWSTHTLAAMCIAAGRGRHYPLSEAGVWTDCIHQRQSVIHNDYAGLAHRKGVPEGHPTVIRELTVPVIRQERIVAVMGVGNKADPYTDADLQLVAEFANFAMDIVARKQAEETLRINEANLQTLFDAINESVFLMDRDGIILAANTTFAERLGRPLEACIGQPAYAMVPAELAAARKTIIDDILRTGMARKFDDVYAGRWKEHHCYPVKDHTGQVARIVIYAQDLTASKQTEDALRETTQRLQFATASGHLGVWEWDISTGLLIWDDRMCELYGIDRAAFTGLYDDWWQRLHPEDATATLEALSAALRGERDFDVEFRVVHPDGRVKTLKGDAIVLRDDQGNPVRMIGLNLDITARKEAEQALHVSERNFRALFDYAADAIFLAVPDGRIMAANLAACAIFGMSEHELCQRGRASIIDTDDPRLASALEERAQVGFVVNRELTFIRNNGERFPGEVTSVILPGEEARAFVIIRDITERKQAEDALRESEERLRILAMLAPVGIYLTTPAGYCEYANPRWCEMAGLSPEEALGTGWVQGMHPDDREMVMTTWEQMVATEGHWELEYRFLTRDGRTTWVYGTAVRQRNAAGEIVRYVGVNTDITERKQAEEDRAMLQAQLAQAQKMESIGRLAGGVAHDFNNMLGVIIGHAEMALMGLPDDAATSEDLKQILASARRSADLTHQLLAFARKQVVHPVALDLNDTIGGMLKMLQRLIGENITLAWRPGRELWPARLDPSQIDQVLANLAVNARDAIGGIGTVTIETHNITSELGPCPDLAPGDYVRLTVSDTGAGIAPELLPHIFEPFFTTKEVGQGTGLGLSTVFGILKQANGGITVSSEPGAGTTLALYFPRCTEPAETAPNPAAVPPAFAAATTVLVVEDEPAILRIVKTYLERQGFAVLTADRPTAALRLVQDYPDAITLLITDVIMPEMDGAELARRITAVQPNIACLYMSGYTAEILSQQALDAAGAHFLQKPFTLGQLATAIQQCLP